VSLFGGVMSIVIMFVLSYIYALVTFACLLFIYVYLLYHKPGKQQVAPSYVHPTLIRHHTEANWGDSSRANDYRSALHSLFRIQHTEEHVKNYRPQILVLTGNPARRHTLLDLAAQVTKRHALLIAGHVVGCTPVLPSNHPYTLQVSNQTSREERQRLVTSVPHWLQKRHTKAFYVNTFGASYVLRRLPDGQRIVAVFVTAYAHYWTRTDWATCAAILS
jgi:solute carrier family 12 sodium/potassium/chloride transporter 2